MTHEYDDPINAETIESASLMARDLWREQRGAAIDGLVATAVDRTFCGCSTTIEDTVEGGTSGMHVAILQMVRTRLDELLNSERSAEWDAVDLASAESFPASDPPAWISRRP